MQSKNNSLRHGLLAVIAAVVAITLVLSLFTFVATGEREPLKAHAANSSIYSPYTDLEIANDEFDEVSGSDTLMTPSSWTGNAISQASAESVISGTVTIGSFTEDDLEELGMDNLGYVIRTPFGKSASSDQFAGSDANALLINSDGTTTAYGYDSASVALEANSYYEISVWVKTGDFGEDEGASIKVTGLENDIIIEDIDTVDYYYNTYGLSEKEVSKSAEHYFGWAEYKIYIATSTMDAPSITLSLQLGSSISYTNNANESITVSDEAKGWVLFDHVTAKQCSYNMFNNLINGIDNEKKFINAFEDRTYYLSDDGNSLYYSENDSSFLSFDENGNLLFEGDEGYEANEIGSFENGGKGWDAAMDSYSNATTNVGIYSALNEDIGIEVESDIPYSPDGEGGNILMVNSYNGRKYSSTRAGLKSGDFKIERRKNYRISVWVKTVGADCAGIAVAGTDYRGPLNNPGNPNHGKGQLIVSSTELSGESSDTVRYGWSEATFFVQGSAFRDYEIHLELWLGMRETEDSAAVNDNGIAMFDSIRIEEISYTEYTTNSANNSTVTFDGEGNNTVISNGSFDEIEDISYDGNGNAITPYTPSDWTLMTAGEDGTDGMSTHIYDENYRDYVVSGTISSDMTSYNYKLPDTTNSYITGKIDAAVPSDPLPDNLLMIKADESTGLPNDKAGVAVGYRSLSFSVSTDTIVRVDVDMRVDNIKGYGANLVLKSGEKEVATIQRIKDTSSSGLQMNAGDGYNTYSFYIQAGQNSLSELYVEIWLGMYDDELNTSKLSTGTVYVRSVSMTMLTSTTTDEDGTTGTDQTSLNEQRAEFDNRHAEYKASIKKGIIPYFAMYSTYGSTIDSYNMYDDEFLKTPYNWTRTYAISDSTENEAVSYGVYDMKTGGDSSVLPSNYTTNGAEKDDSLVIKNNVTSYSRLTKDVSYTLDSGSYYRITVLMQVYIPNVQDSNDAQGAYFGIDGTTYMLSNIRSTTDKNGKGEFQEFNLYIKTDGTAPSESEDDSSTTEESTTKTINLIFGIGDQNVSERAIGTMIINNIELEAIDSTTFDEAKDKIENSGAISGSHDAIADYTGGSSDTEQDEDDDDVINEDLSGNNWYIYISVVLAVVIIIAVIAALVRYMAIKRKKSGDVSPTDKTTYDREITLLRQHNARNTDEVNEITEGYDAFDEDIEDHIEMMRALEEVEQLAEENSDAESAENAEADADEVKVIDAETSEEPAEEESKEATAEEGTTEQAEEAPATEEVAEQAETAESAETEETEEEGYSYSDEIVDFTPSEERRRELEEAKAEKARIKAEKEAAKKAEEDARARLEAERKEATRRYNKWDDFED